MADSQEMLLVVHDRDEMDDRASAWARRRGYALRWICPADGDTLPALDERVAGIVVYGGAQDVDQQDRFPYLKDEMLLLESALKREVPVLGLCLGAQLLAHMLGETVSGHPEGHAEYGYYDLVPTAEGRSVFGAPMKVLQSHWHGWYRTPKGTVKLAGTEAFPEQAFRHGRNAYGFQFHPETSRAGLTRWISRRAPHKQAMKGAHPADRQLADNLLYDRALAAWFDAFLDAWTDGRQIGYEAAE
ncbi:MAG: gamma-glutamyl-gamma-aminobutyrate hydrolase family protein [Parvibaculaceae bacterium]